MLEEGLKLLTDHWMLVMGLLIVGVVLVSRRGLYGGLPDAPLRLRAARPCPTPPENRDERAARRTPGQALRRADRHRRPVAGHPAG
ncbi:hypothetical protein WJ972_20330 [Achromobacter insuavis]